MTGGGGWEHLVGGLAGGAASTLVTHPFDLLKIRFAVHEGRTTEVRQRKTQHTTYRRAIRQLYGTAGVRGLFQGLSPNLVGATISWGVCLQFYHSFKKTFPVQDGAATDARNTVASLLAGAITLAATNPLWVCKTQMCLQYENERGTIYSTLRRLYVHEGARGLYRGFVPGLWGTSSGALQIVIYDAMKRHYYQMSHDGQTEHYNDKKLPNYVYVTFSATSKMMSTLMTYPYQVVRARLQDQHTRYTGVMHCIRSTRRREGLLGFYKGMGVSLLKATPATVVTMVVYENVLHAMADEDV